MTIFYQTTGLPSRGTGLEYSPRSTLFATAGMSPLDIGDTRDEPFYGDDTGRLVVTRLPDEISSPVFNYILLFKPDTYFPQTWIDNGRSDMYDTRIMDTDDQTRLDRNIISTDEMYTSIPYWSDLVEEDMYLYNGSGTSIDNTTDYLSDPRDVTDTDYIALATANASDPDDIRTIGPFQQSEASGKKVVATKNRLRLKMGRRFL